MQVSPGAKYSIRYVDPERRTDLKVAAFKYRIDSGVAVLQSEKVELEHLAAGVYVATETMVVGTSWLYIMANWNDDSFTEWSTDPAQTEHVHAIGSTFFGMFSWDYTDYGGDDDLFIRSAIYKTTTGAAVLQGTQNLVHLQLGCYWGHVATTRSDSYVASSQIYLDAGYTMLDAGRIAAAASFTASDLDYPDEGEVTSGTGYANDQLEGERNVVENTIQQIDLKPIGDEITLTMEIVQ